MRTKCAFLTVVLFSLPTKTCLYLWHLLAINLMEKNKHFHCLPIKTVKVFLWEGVRFHSAVDKYSPALMFNVDLFSVSCLSEFLSDRVTQRSFESATFPADCRGNLLFGGK